MRELKGGKKFNERFLRPYPNPNILVEVLGKSKLFLGVERDLSDPDGFPHIVMFAKTKEGIEEVVAITFDHYVNEADKRMKPFWWHVVGGGVLCKRRGVQDRLRKFGFKPIILDQVFPHGVRKK